MHNKYIKPRFPSFLSRCFTYLVPLILVLLVSAQNVFSAEVTLAWDPNSQEKLAGYRIFCRNVGQSYDYNDPAWEGGKDETACTISNLNDNTTYYFVARAYDEAGNESGDSDEVCYEPNFGELATASSDSREVGRSEGTASADDGGGCFIATAAFGSYIEPHVKLLRDFRDQRLLTNMPGRWFVRMYYRHSPFWADLINTHSWCKPIVRLALMPVVCLSYITVRTSVEPKLIAALFLFLAFMVILWHPLLFLSFRPKGMPCPPWRDSFSIDVPLLSSRSGPGARQESGNVPESQARSVFDPAFDMSSGRM